VSGLNAASRKDVSNDLLDHSALQFRKTLFAPLMQVGERILVKSQLMQDSGVDVAEVTRLINRTQSNGIRSADHLTALDTAARHPHRESKIIMVAPSPVMNWYFASPKEAGRFCPLS